MKTVGTIAHDIEFARFASKVICPANFTNLTHKKVVDIVFEHVERYGPLPDKTAVFERVSKEMAKSKGLSAYLGMIHSVYDYAEFFDNTGFLKDQLTEFSRRKALAQAVCDVHDGKKTAIEARDALTQRFEAIDTAVATSGKQLLQKWSEVREEAKHCKPVWIIPGWVRLGALHLFTGDPFSGKSCIVADIIGAIAHEHEWATIQTRQCPIVLVDLENDPAILTERVDRALVEFGGDGAIEDVVSRFNPDAMPCPIGREHFEAIVSQFPPESKGLIVVDTLRSCRADDPEFKENDNSVLSQTLKPWRDFCRKSGWGLVVLHHNKKTGGYSGGTACPVMRT